MTFCMTFKIPHLKHIGPFFKKKIFFSDKKLIIFVLMRLKSYIVRKKEVRPQDMKKIALNFMPYINYSFSMNGGGANQSPSP